MVDCSIIVMLLCGRVALHPLYPFGVLDGKSFDFTGFEAPP